MIKRIWNMIPSGMKRYLRAIRDFYKIRKIQIGQRDYVEAIEKLSRREKKETIQIAIFMILCETWNSFVSIYQEIEKIQRIELSIYLIPNCEFNGPNIDSYKSTMRFFDQLKIPYIKTYNERSGEWISTDGLEFDYLFYSLPYKEQLPIAFRPEQFAKRVKLCYIPYGFILTNDEGLLGTVLEYEFLQHLYALFSSWEAVTVYSENVYKKIGTKYHNVLQLGYPRFDLLRPVENKNNTLLHVLWIPRFSFEGRAPSENTSFFKFKDQVVDRIKEIKDEYWIIRPHPLAFQTYIEKGVMTKEAISHFSETIQNSPKSTLDGNKDYLDSFSKSDVILADFSSLIIEYLMSEKPIIYCGVKEAIPMKDLLDSMYCVNSWDDVLKVLEMLKDGNDPLKTKRQKLIQELNPGNNCGKRIIEYIINDYDE